MKTGLSGGVSFQGTAAGLLGAGAMAVLCNYLTHSEMKAGLTAFVALLGFAGMLLDSVLGAAWQARFQNPGSAEILEEPGERARLISGWRWLDNDAVNLLSNAATVLVAFAVG
jgi:uncharacterized membrane protein